MGMAEVEPGTSTFNLRQTPSSIARIVQTHIPKSPRVSAACCTRRSFESPGGRRCPGAGSSPMRAGAQGASFGDRFRTAPADERAVD